MPRERRLKILYLPEDYLLTVLDWFTDAAEHGPQPRYRQWLKTAGLPDDLRVRAVSYDAPRATFAVLVESETFEPVAPGTLPPELRVQWVHVWTYEGSPLAFHGRPAEET